MTIAEIIFETPELLAALGAVVYAVVRYQRGLSWYEYRTLHGLKRLVFPILNESTALGVSVVNDKRHRANATEYVRTTDRSIRDMAGALVAVGGSYHLVNSLKSRPEANGTGVEYSRAHVVFFHDDGTQTEIYLFRGSDGTDVYGHHETAVTDPDEHIQRTRQVDGDPRDVLSRVDAEANGTPA